MDRAHDSLISGLVLAADHGSASLDALVPLLYDELRAMAHRQLMREQGDATLQTTALVHEAYLKLAAGAGVTAKGRAYFFAAAARAMRQVLVDHARRRIADKRGGGALAVSLSEHDGAVSGFAAEVLDLDTALVRLAGEYPRQAQVVECRFFGGLSVDETAETLGVSARTVKGDWALARAWLYDALDGSRPTT